MRQALITASISALLAFSTSVASANLLTNPGFDTAPLGPTLPVMQGNFPLYQGQWSWEAGSIVPPGGSFPTSPPFQYAFQAHGVTTEVAQVFDVTTFAPAIDSGNAQLVAGTLLNTGSAATFGSISVNYFSSNTFGSILAPNPNALLALDPSLLTWEPLNLGPVTMPFGTRWVMFTIGFDSATLAGTTGLSGGAYTDDAFVDIHVVPEPGSLGVLAAAGSALLMRRRRR